MNQINERLRELRQQTGLSQEAFGAKIGMSRGEIKNLEYNITTLKELKIPMICQAYSVNEEWLRYGNGDMFKEVNTSDALNRFFGDIMKEDNADFRRRFLAVLSRMTPDEWEILEHKIQEIANEP